MQRLAASARLPLRNRLPNPPHVFVGREREQQALERALERGPVALVWGVEGTGKTALVLSALHERFPKRALRTVSVAMRPGDPPEQISMDVVQALAQIRGVAAGELPHALNDPDALLAVAIDLAEESDHWIVVDDLHHGEPASVTRWVEQLARYARRSRWILMSRTNVSAAELAGTTVVVRGLPRGDLLELARRWTPAGSTRELSVAVAASHGSPRRLRRALDGEAEDHEPASVLRDVSAGEMHLLEQLAVFDAALSADALEATGIAVTTRMIKPLERRGLIETSPAGLRLPDLVRADVLSAVDRKRLDEHRRHAAAVLARGDAEAATEALRLWAEVLDVAAIERLLERRLHELLAAGQGTRVWSALEHAPGLDDWRLQIAAELGGGPALGWALARPEPPPSSAVWARLAWLRTRIHGSDFVMLAREARAHAQIETDDMRRATAAVLAMYALMQIGRTAEALECLYEVAVESPEAAAVLGAARARAQARAGRCREAIALADAAMVLLPSLPWEAQRTVRTECMAAYMRAGDLRKALHAAGSSTQRAVPLALRTSTQSLANYAALLAYVGRGAEAGALLDRIEALLDVTTSGRMFVRYVRQRLRMSDGRFEGLEAELASTIESAEARRDPTQLASQVVNAHELAVQLGKQTVAHVDIAGAAAQARARSAWQRILAARHGGPSMPVPVADDAVLEVRILDALASAEACLANDDVDEALRYATDAARSASEHGHVMMEASARETVCAVLAAGSGDGLLGAADELGAVAETLESARHRTEARLYRVIATAPVDPLALEEIASLGLVAPAAARRARAILGDGAGCDALDRRIAEAFVRRRRARFVRLHDAGSREPRWGIDELRKNAWLHGRAVPLSAQSWSVLETIARQGGEAERETIARTALGVADYHKLRDENRLKVAVRRLRQAIERAGNGKAPACIMTTKTGYAFGGTVTVLRPV